MREYLREGTVAKKENRRMKLSDKCANIDENLDMTKLMGRFNDVANLGIYKYWDDLISFGSSLLDNCADTDSL